jgi:hypothetical protein
MVFVSDSSFQFPTNHITTMMKHFAKTGIARLRMVVLLASLSIVTFPTLSFAISIGDEYAGGIVFYIDDTGSHGLVASDTDVRGTRTWDEAIAACSNFNKNGYSDWILPDREQLAALYTRRSVVGGFVPNNAYWSSSPSPISGCAWLQYFSTGSQYCNFPTNALFYVRAIRAF